MGVYIGEPIVISDMQGPAPDGFHVPTKDEWVALCGILTSTFGLTSNATTMGTYLKMPLTGRRQYYTATVDYVGSYGYYWSSSPYSADYAYYLYFSSSNMYPQVIDNRSYGFSVRCFKNEPVIPTSSWTTLYQGMLAGSGVFWNSTDGLISISGDGFDWITIQDKNLGATTVYNQGNTHTDANCGYFYQWGNNYGFPHSGSVTTSSTKVDASNYGPGNYYESSTFITGSANWSNVQNNNLRGGVSQGTTIRGDLKNAYIGGRLKSYEEIVAMATSEGWPRTNTIAELNTAPTDYYDMLNSEGYMVFKGFEGYNGYYINGIMYSEGITTYYIAYIPAFGYWIIKGYENIPV